MRKLVIIISLFVFSLFSLYSETKTIPSVVFTAYKGSYDSTGIPQVMTGEFRIISSENETVTSSTKMSISSEYRNKVFDFFSWVANGNASGTVTLSFKFSPLSFTNSSNVTSTIPYTIALAHTTTLVDGVLVAMNRDSGNLENLSPRKCTFSDKYFVWADTISTRIGPTGNYTSGTTVSADVSTADVTVFFQYNLATGTLTKEKNAQDEWVVVKEENSPTAYPYSVTDHWTRSGECEITLKITAEGTVINSETAYAMGLYQAQVTVEMMGP